MSRNSGDDDVLDDGPVIDLFAPAEASLAISVACIAERIERGELMFASDIGDLLGNAVDSWLEEQP